MKKADDVFKKPLQALVLVPKEGKLTPFARKMFNAMLKVTVDQIRDLAYKNETIPATHMFSAPLSELMSASSPGTSDGVTWAKECLEMMMRVRLDWRAPDQNADVLFRLVPLLSEAAGVKKVNGSLFIEWALPPSLMKIISDPNYMFTPVNLRYMSNLTTYAGVALYEFATRYHNNPRGMTSIHPVEYFVEAFSSSKVDTSSENLWARFKDRFLNNGIVEVNKYSDLTVSLLEKKTGKKITHAQFLVKRKSGVQSDEGDPYKLSESSAVKVMKLGLRLSDVKGLRHQGATEKMVDMCLDKLAARIAQPDVEPVKNRLAYMRTILKDVEGFISKKAPQIEASESAQELLPMQLDVMQKQVAVPLKSVDQLMQEEFKSLSNTTKTGYALRAQASLQERNMFTASMSRHLAQETYTGVFLQEMINIYAEEEHGEEWRNVYSVPTKE